MRHARAAALVLIALVAAAALAVGWYYSDQILGPDRRPARRGQTVRSHTDSTITLAPTRKARRPGRWAIEWPGGYGEVGSAVGPAGDNVVRRFRIAEGRPPDTTARLAGFAFDANPLTWLGVPYRDVRIPARVGPLPAWWLEGRDSTWAIFVHGRAASRAEVLRMLAGYRSLGMPCLIICYRNDAGAPHVDGGSYRMGATEWQDLEDAARFALAHGARDLVPVGCSMGGGIVVQFLRHSELRRAVRAAVLDAPALDWEAVFAQASRERRVAPTITALGLEVSALRSGIRWRDLTQALHARELATPLLIFHGDSDTTVPYAVSERFAAARPDLVTLVRFPGADHVESSNFDSRRYESELVRWLRAQGVGRADDAPGRARAGGASPER
jgi:alpha-beta hydrolase superfamily lysophospholipase